MFPDDDPILFDRIVVFWSLRYAMTIARYPAKEEYWKGVLIQPFKYPDFGAFMSLDEFEYIEKLMRFSRYTIQRAHSNDRMWKVRDFINE